jgi:predicted dehydrogenase
MKKIGFIDYYLHEWHSDNMPKWIADETDGEMQVCYAWGEIDHPDGGKTNKVWCDEMGIELCGSIEEVVERSDYLIVLAPDNPERHMDLCRLPLASGKKTFVDKTFAESKADAKLMVEYANKHNTPFFTSSSLRFAKEYQGYQGNKAAREGQVCTRESIVFINSYGPGLFKDYAIHQIEPIVFMMDGAAHRVLSLGSPDKPTLIYDYADGRHVVMHMYGWEIDFGMMVHHREGYSTELKVESDFFALFTKELVQFFETGMAPFPISQAIDVAAMLEAGSRAIVNPGEWVGV